MITRKTGLIVACALETSGRVRMYNAYLMREKVIAAIFRSVCWIINLCPQGPKIRVLQSQDARPASCRMQ